MMKRIFAALMTLAILLCPTYADAASKQLEKARNKELKTKLKEYKKGKWEILGSHTLEVALAEHYDKLNSLDDAQEYPGVSTRTKSKNTGKQMAINNAVITYAQSAGNTLKGRVVSDLSASGINTDTEIENFYAAYERLVEKEIRNELKPSYTIIHSNPDSTYEVQTYFIYSESAATKARMRALENAAKESALAQKLAEKMSEFVQAGIE